MDNGHEFSAALFPALFRGALKGAAIAIFILVFRHRLSVPALVTGMSGGVLVGIGTQYLWYYLHQRRVHFSLKEAFGDTYMDAFRREAERVGLGAMIDRRWFSRYSEQRDKF